MDRPITNPTGDPELEDSYLAYIDSLEPCARCGAKDEMMNIEGRALCTWCELDEWEEANDDPYGDNEEHE